jgi:hypothetical protein
MGYAAVALMLVGAPSRAMAQADHDHAGAAQPGVLTAAQQARANELVQAVRQATAKYKNVQQAEADGFALMFGCVSGGDFGAMGLHFVNMKNVNDGVPLVDKPDIVLYEPLPNGGFALTGADYLVDAATWDAGHPNDPPQLDGQLFHFFDAPNRFGLKPFYTLHVWAWKDNPNGTFTNWNPSVSCDAFNPPPGK